MAKAAPRLHGSADPRRDCPPLRENHILRQRVADLEAADLRLQMENDTLATMAAEAADEEVLEAGLRLDERRTTKTNVVR